MVIQAVRVVASKLFRHNASGLCSRGPWPILLVTAGSQSRHTLRYPRAGLPLSANGDPSSAAFVVACGLQATTSLQDPLLTEHGEMQNQNHGKRAKNRARQQASNPQPVAPAPMAPVSEPSAHRNENGHTGKDDDDLKTPSLDRWHKASVVFNGLLVFTAFIGWYYIDRQLKMTAQSNQVATHALEESRKANDLYRQDLEITNRAWITVREPKLGRDGTGTLDADPMWVTFEFENTGKVPAENIEIKVIRTFLHKTDEAKIVEDNPYFGSLAPGQKLPTWHKCVKLEKATVDAINSGEVTMVMKGVVVFADHFAKREQRFCFWWSRHLSMFVACQERDPDSAHHPNREK